MQEVAEDQALHAVFGFPPGAAALRLERKGEDGVRQTRPGRSAFMETKGKWCGCEMKGLKGNQRAVNFSGLRTKGEILS